MAALAWEVSDEPYRLIPCQQEPSKAQSAEAQQILESTNRVLSSLSETKTFESAKLDAVRLVLERGNGYASLSFITRETGLSVEDFRNIISETDQFKKSFMVTNYGDEVYRLNRRFGELVDLWKTFAYLNYMKF